VLNRLAADGGDDTVPHSVHLNDVASFDFPASPTDYEQQMIDEFEHLYAEGAQCRRMMVIGLHERLSGHPSRVRVLDRILTRLREHDDLWWARKDQIAQWKLDHPDTVTWVNRDPTQQRTTWPQPIELATASPSPGASCSQDTRVNPGNCVR
jgi:hypothetical protein